MKANSKIESSAAVAIIGMGCLFPKSSGLKAYWRLLFNGMDGISEVPDSHWSVEDYFSSAAAKQDHVYCKRGGFLSPVPFDPTEFGIPPNLLEATDSSQLLGLLVAKQSLEDAGYGYSDKNFNRDRTSVILGVTGTQELVIPLGARLGHPNWRRALASSGIHGDKATEIMGKISDSHVSWQEGSFPGLLGNVVAGRICNRLDLGGTNCVVDAACASSMSALHLSLLELLSGYSDMVVTGGVDTLNDIFMHMCFSSTHILSPSDEVRPFSQGADGTLLGEGIGMLVLKRLADAERDGDRIYAVVKGLGASSDGRSQSIYAPRAEGQAKALRTAYRRADVNPASVELIEAHGTGTRVGDRVEVEALRELFTDTNDTAGPPGQSCALGSVKSMIGHTKAAAGSAGLIKAALALHHKVLPATIKADQPDPELHLATSPFYLNHQSRPWFSHPHHPRRAGVSAFGFGGSNFHAVLEEYRLNKDQISWDGSVEIVALSGADFTVLARRLKDWQVFFENNPSDDDIARKAADSRDQFSHKDAKRLLAVLEHPFEAPVKAASLFSKAAETLGQRSDETHWNVANVFFGSHPKQGKLVFMFPGQGSQYVGMGRDLICTFPEALSLFEQANHDCDLPRRLNEYVYPPPVTDKKSLQQQEEQLRSTDIAQPAIGAVSLMMASVLESFGVRPEITCGHSYGELCAHFAAGWLDLKTLFHLSVMRGRYMAAAGKNGQEAGGMLAAKAPLEELQSLVDRSGLDLVLANRNSPTQGVLSGTHEAIEKAVLLCKEHGFRAIKLPVAAAFHSRLVKDAQRPFARELQQIQLVPGKIPVFSNTTAKAYPMDPAAAKKILAQQILQPVDFVNEIKHIFSRNAGTFLEVGPRAVLTGLVKAILKTEDIHCVSVDSSAGKKSGLADLARCLAQLATLGHRVDLNRWGGPPPPAPKRKPVMNIPISGANSRNSDTPKQKPDRVASDSYRPPEKFQPTRPSAGPMKVNTEEKPQPVPPSPERKDVNLPAPDSSLAAQALEAVRQGLAAIEQLQQETARSHQMFLKNQQEATTTLRQMMAHTQNVAEAALAISGQDLPVLEDTSRMPMAEPSVTRTEARLTPAPPEPIVPSTSKHIPLDGRPASPEIEEPVALPALQDTGIHPTAQATAQEPWHGPAAVEKILLEVVADLTGYPVEMLRLDMDIEADLGIDSIKRVEILSAFEEKLPDLPSINPDKVSALKTLGQIVDMLAVEGDTEASSHFSDGAQRSADSPVPTDITSAPEVKTVEQALLASVADLTGYPVEMLRLDMDIEADLGIDSIKRVEILSAFEEKLPDLPSINPEKVSALKTLGQIVDMLAVESPAQKPPIEDKNAPNSNNTNKLVKFPKKILEIPEPTPPAGWPSGIERRCVYPQETFFQPGSPLHFPSDGCFFILSAAKDKLAEELESHLVSRQVNTRRLAFSELEGFDPEPQGAAGLIIFADQELPCDGPSLYHGTFIKNAFSITRRFAPSLLAAAENGGAVFATVSRMDGCFGFDSSSKGDWSPLNGGLGGIVKTASQEWPGILCRAFDVPHDCRELSTVSEALVRELMTPVSDSPVEIGLLPHEKTLKRMVLTLAPGYPDSGDDTELNLQPGDVMVVSGGARGITAAVTHAFAEKVRPTLVLFGRTPTVFAEPSWLKDAVDPAEIKKAILENEFSDAAAPLELERAFRRYRANREIAASLHAFEAAGAKVYYHSVDIRDWSGVNQALSQIKKLHGPVRAVIHAAGVLEDRLIIDKTAVHFERVFDTKVGGLGALLHHVDMQDLRYLVLFSSVAARMGNHGQADYAAANEVLNKIAQRYARRLPNCRCLAVNWGPWDGGMVSSSLKQAFARRGIDLIPVQEGVHCLQIEMGRTADNAVEIVVGAKLTPDSRDESASARSQPQSKLSLAFKHCISPDNHRVLKSHVIDGTPVVPFALMTEWIGYGALHENPGLLLHGMRDVRLLKGIRLDGEEKMVRLLAGKARKNQSTYEIDVEVRDGIVNGRETIHSRGTVLLTETLSQAPHFDLEKHLGVEPYQRDRREIYDRILFHGSSLQGIRRVLSSTRKSMVAEIDAAPHPSDWVDHPMRSRWLIDPLVLDCAFQMAILWCYDHEGMGSLPSYTRSYTQYQRCFPKNGVTIVLEIQASTKKRMRGNFNFLDEDGKLVARLEGYEAVMSPSLLKAFRANSAA